MKNWTRIPTFIATILLVCAISAMRTTPARADDGTPPPPETPSVTTPPDGSAVDLSEVPANTKVVVLDKQGKKLPLASQAAADTLAVGDPMWCPTGVAPGGVGCSGPFGTLALLVAGFTPTGNGTIWVQSGAVAGINIDASVTWSAAKNFSLTIQGGWSGTADGTPASLLLDPVNPYSTFSGSGTDRLSIVNWVGGITLNNLIFNSASDTTGSNYSTLDVETKGNIVVSKVQVNDANNSGLGVASGANLDNTTGTGNVTVKDSSFNNNEGTGLNILSKGTVTLKNVVADNNGVVDGDNGVYIDSTSKSVVITNSEFNGNGYRGATILSKGAVTMTSLVADNNADAGVYVDNTWLNVAKSVSLNGVNDFSGNVGNGLTVLSYGAIKVSNTTANGNSGGGVSLDNCRYVEYDVVNHYFHCLAPSAQPVTIVGFLTALNNSNSGLDIESKGLVTSQAVVSGVTVKANLTLNHNGGYGAYIDNCQWDANPLILKCGGTGAVQLTGFNAFNNNTSSGIEVRSRGSIAVNNIAAIFNGSYGAYLKNSYMLTVLSPVIVGGSNLFSDNSNLGLNVLTYGAVTLNNLTAVNNSGTGASVNNGGPASPKTVTIKGTNVFKSNNGYGLAVYATGAITLSNVTASLNDADGVYLQNDLIKVQTKVTLTGYGLFEWNGSADPFFQDGLYVQSHGAITLANITANYNFGNGAILSTAGVSAPQAVTLTGTNNFNYNGDASQESGLIVNSDGNIIVNNLNANYNYYGGAYLDNQTNWANRVPSPFLTFGSVTLTGVGNFDGNTLWDGLQVLTHGSVTLNHVTANENGGSGSGIDLSSVDGNATLICSRVYGNAAYGLYGAVTGTLTLTGFSAYGNTPADESISYGTVVRTTCP